MGNVTYIKENFDNSIKSVANDVSDLSEDAGGSLSSGGAGSRTYVYTFVKNGGGGRGTLVDLGGPGDVLELHGIDDLDISALPVTNDDGSSFLNLTFLRDGDEVGGVTLDYRNGPMIETLRKGEGGWEIDLRPIYEYATGT